MPLSFDQISAITHKKILPKLEDNIFNSNPLLQRAKSKWYDKVDGGTSILAPLNYAMVSASGWYAGSQTLDTSDNDIITAAEYSWKQSYVNITIQRIDELKNAGDSKVLSILKSKSEVAEKTLGDILATGIYNAGTTTNAILGLRNIVSASNTVGGISQSTYTWWAGQVDSTTTTQSIAAMQALYNNCAVNSDKPSVIATTRSVYNSYYALLQPQQRFMDAKSADGGFDSLMFNGAPVLPDSYCPSGYLFMLNEKYLSLSVHKDEDFRFEPFQKPVNQNVKVAKIYWAGALVSSNNRLQGVQSALTG